MLLVFVGTLFLSAMLLLLVEPMVGKMVLPMLGGSPAVWNTCMVFFQAMLLAGYLYAHVSTTVLGSRKQAGLHLVLMVATFLVLPVLVKKDLAPSGEDNPVIGVLFLLTVAVGLPFFVVSASAPLLQKWFASTDHPAARDPYFLYAASNLGSMLAPPAYLFLLEPHLRLAQQSLFWTLGYGLLLALTGLCAYLMWKSAPAPAAAIAGAGSTAITAQPAHGSTAITAKPQKKKGKEKAETEEAGPLTLPVTLLRRLHWIALAFVPSSLLLGATTYITTDIAAIPLLWLLPLTLYLLSFILVFSRLPGWVHKGFLLVMPLVVLLLLFFLLSHESPMKYWQNILLQLVVLFVVAMVMHGELARMRPATSHLTEFYVWMSVGGVLGGMFNALVAPIVFNSIVEYQIALVLACLLMPRLGPIAGTGLGFKVDLAIAAALAVLAFMAFYMGIEHIKPDLAEYQEWQIAQEAKNLPVSGSVLSRIAHWQADLKSMRLGLAIIVGFVLMTPLGLVLTRDPKLRGWWFDCFLPMALGLTSAALLLAFYNRDWEFDKFRDFVRTMGRGRFDFSAETVAKLLVFGLPALLCYVFVERPLRFGLAVGAFVLASGMYDLRPSSLINRERSYFGVLKVNEYLPSEIPYHSLTHGTTTHGMQCMAEEYRSEPLTYYHRNGPVGQLFAAYPELTHNYAVIGLGTGSMAAYGDKEHKVTFYEIDRHVRAIASNPKYFTYLTDYEKRRGEEIKIVMGDARLQMEKANPEEYGIILVDAFSSDAIPVHLITQEAVEMLFEKTADNGIVAYHISNRWLDLAPVLYHICRKLGLSALIKHDGGDNLGNASEWYASTWVALARNPEDLERLTRSEWLGPSSARQMCMVLGGCWPGPSISGLMTIIGGVGERPVWVPLSAPPDEEDEPKWTDDRPWTDDFSNILQVFDWKR
jgi:hypothetical protein